MDEALKYLHHASGLLRADPPAKHHPMYFEINRTISLVQNITRELAELGPPKGSA